MNEVNGKALWDMPIMEARRERWLKGRREYGPRWGGRHPLLEEYEELLDAYNYEELHSPGSNRASAIYSLLDDLQRTMKVAAQAGYDLTKWDGEV